ncbi:MAG: DUF309 domain-containing protein [Mycobacteriales bacterium]|nr:DUF309 domain-containing protein [Frankia sp.]
MGDPPTPRVDRDRDPAGRPRNARPRDALGRPLPRGGENAGWRERLAAADAEVALPPEAALAEADRLLATGRPFEAHEVLEAVWHVAPPDERDLWQGLAQVAVGVTHIYRGNPVGAAALLQRAANRISVHVGVEHGVDITRLTAEARALAELVATSGVDAARPVAEGLRLRG